MAADHRLRTIVLTIGVRGTPHGHLAPRAWVQIQGATGAIAPPRICHKGLKILHKPPETDEIYSLLLNSPPTSKSDLQPCPRVGQVAHDRHDTFLHFLRS